MDSLVNKMEGIHILRLIGHSKIVDNFARTSFMIASGTPSSLWALREAKSSERG